MNRMLSIFAVIVLALGVLAGCSDNATISVKVDSTGKNLDSAAGKIWDSTKAGAKRVGEKVEELGEKAKEKIDNVDIHIGKKDSTKN